MSDLPIKHLLDEETKSLLALGVGSVVAAFIVVEVVIRIHHLF